MGASHQQNQPTPGSLQGGTIQHHTPAGRRSGPGVPTAERSPTICWSGYALIAPRSPTCRHRSAGPGAGACFTAPLAGPATTPPPADHFRLQLSRRVIQRFRDGRRLACVVPLASDRAFVGKIDDCTSIRDRCAGKRAAVALRRSGSRRPRCDLWLWSCWLRGSQTAALIEPGLLFRDGCSEVIKPQLNLLVVVELFPRRRPNLLRRRHRPVAVTAAQCPPAPRAG